MGENLARTNTFALTCRQSDAWPPCTCCTKTSHPLANVKVTQENQCCLHLCQASDPGIEGSSGQNQPGGKAGTHCWALVATEGLI